MEEPKAMIESIRSNPMLRCRACSGRRDVVVKLAVYCAEVA